MPDQNELQEYLAGATVDPEVYALRPDYRVMLLAVNGIVPGPSDPASERLLVSAEMTVAGLDAAAVQEIPHVAAWRDAYRAFGAKPQRTRNSLEALLRRATNGLPRVNRLTDIYNAISVQHLVPLGGEDLSRYAGPPRLTRATGEEEFDTTADGAEVIEHPEPGEVVWRDDTGVTCRRWNWRQCRRTQLTDDTTSALFILDALEPLSDDALEATANALIGELLEIAPGVAVAQRLVSATPTGA